MGIAGAALWTVALLVAGTAATGWLERALSGGVEAGPAGPVAWRERIDLPRRDSWLYGVAPAVALAGTAWALVVIPFGPRLVGADLEVGAFYYLVVVDLVVVGLALGGWGANARHGVEACYRAVAQLVAYVVPLGLAVLGPLMMARTLSTVEIVGAQAAAGVPYLLVQPLGFALYVVTALMQSYRSPFLEPFADRIGRGVLGLYGGAPALLWRLALSGLLFAVGAMGAVLYLGGWAGPWLPGPVWMAAKTLALVALLVGGGRRVRPRSTAGMLALSWKVLIPVGLVNVLVVGAEILLGIGQSPFASSGGPP